MTHKFPYSWRMADGYPAPGIQPNGLKVFGTFICGGGSTMGYKLAGYEHLGGVEIDEKVSAIYARNHHPKYLYTEDLRVFNKRENLPDELYQLDLLDGSPPCSTFSLAGSREKAWGKEKVFAEGQALQTLDDLVFVYCETIIKLQPKVFLLENVKGLAQVFAQVHAHPNEGGAAHLAAQGYTIVTICNYDSYEGTADTPRPSPRPSQNAEAAQVSTQKAATTKENRSISKDIESIVDIPEFRPIVLDWMEYKRERGQAFKSRKGITQLYNRLRQLSGDDPALARQYAADSMAATFPLDYDYTNIGRLRFLTGMSVPPVMTAQVAHQIAVQVFGKPS